MTLPLRVLRVTAAAESSASQSRDEAEQQLSRALERLGSAACDASAGFAAMTVAVQRGTTSTKDMIDALGKLQRYDSRRDPTVVGLSGLTEGTRIISDPYLTVTEQRSLSFWERIRARLEDLVDGAELTPELYPWPRVARTVTRPSPHALIFGDSIVVHPKRAQALASVLTE